MFAASFLCGAGVILALVGAVDGNFVTGACGALAAAIAYTVARNETREAVS